jgi:hypothetical protein
VIDDRTQALLQDVVRRESRSLLAYLHDAYPWATSREEGTLTGLRGLAAEEGRAVAALGEYLARQNLAPPPLASYPSSFTTLNFLSLDFLLPRLARVQHQSVADLERDLAAVHDAGARGQLEKLLATKQRTLAGLEGLLAGLRTPAASA